MYSQLIFRKGLQGRESNPGLPFSKPTRYYLSYAALLPNFLDCLEINAD
jgi:amino acid permease